MIVIRLFTLLKFMSRLPAVASRLFRPPSFILQVQIWMQFVELVFLLEIILVSICIGLEK